MADVAIHTPSRAGDERNHHAHIMLTTRKAELGADNRLVLTEKIDLELSNAKRKELGLQSSSKEIISIRQDWEQVANAHLERAGIAERIDHQNALERTTEPQKAQESDLLAKAQASLQNRLQERLNEREQARQAEQQTERERQAQEIEQSRQNQDRGFSR